jgi:hypothetical protein
MGALDDEVFLNHLPDRKPSRRGSQLFSPFPCRIPSEPPRPPTLTYPLANSPPLSQDSAEEINALSPITHDLDCPA